MVNEEELQIVTAVSSEAEPVMGQFATRPGTFDQGIIGEQWQGLFYTKHPAFGIRAGDRVVDIGAHIGAFAIFAAVKGAVVLAFEPMADNFTILEKNRRLNQSGSLTVHPLAVTGDGRNVVMIPCSDDENTGGGWTSRQDGEGEEREHERVESMTLDEIVTSFERVDFLKMDCEGAEYEILMQASPATIAKVEKIAMEWHGGRKAFDELREFLKEKGFREEWHGTEHMGSAYFWRA